MHQDQTILQTLPGICRNLVLSEHMVLWQQASPADPELWVAWGGSDAADEFDSWPDTSRVLPTAARSPS